MTADDQVTELVDRLDQFAERVDAEVFIVRRSEGSAKRSGHRHTGGEWTVAMTWGAEAPDSPMVGAAAHGIADTYEEALTQALDEADGGGRGV